MSIRDFINPDNDYFTYGEIICNNIDCSTINGKPVSQNLIKDHVFKNSITSNDNSINIENVSTNVFDLTRGSQNWAFYPASQNVDLNNNYCSGMSSIRFSGSTGNISLFQTMAPQTNLGLYISDAPPPYTNSIYTVYDSFYNKPPNFALKDILKVSNDCGNKNITNLDNVYCNSLTINGVPINGGPKLAPYIITKQQYNYSSNQPFFNWSTNNASSNYFSGLTTLNLPSQELYNVKFRLDKLQITATLIDDEDDFGTCYFSLYDIQGFGKDSLPPPISNCISFELAFRSDLTSEIGYFDLDLTNSITEPLTVYSSLSEINSLGFALISSSNGPTFTEFSFSGTLLYDNSVNTVV